MARVTSRTSAGSSGRATLQISIHSRFFAVYEATLADDLRYSSSESYGYNGGGEMKFTLGVHYMHVYRALFAGIHKDRVEA